MAHPHPTDDFFRNHPGYRTLLNTLGPIENFFPRIPGVTPGAFHMWHRKHKDFELHGWDVITYVRLPPPPLLAGQCDVLTLVFGTY